MRRALVLGAGGHCRAIIAILFDLGFCKNIEIIDLFPLRSNELILGIPVTRYVKNVNELGQLNEVDVYLAIGDNARRLDWWEKLKEMDLSTPNLISPHAIVSPSVTLGDGNIIAPNVFIGPNVQLGCNNIINTGVILEHEAKIGSHSHIAPASVIAGRSEIGDRCFIGARSVVINNLKVVSDTILGAGSTLVKSIIEPGETYYGVPARKKVCAK
jgi:UDP-N-acetylbacillosamine N-acetyltransferase